jgi:hypothetical protein
LKAAGHPAAFSLYLSLLVQTVPNVSILALVLVNLNIAPPRGLGTRHGGL